MHWDEDMGELRCHRIKEAAAQNAVPTNGGTSADGDRHTNNATTGAFPHEADAYADAQRPPSLNLMDAQVLAALTCDNEPVPPHATAGSGTSVDISTPDDHGTSGLLVDEGAIKLMMTDVHASRCR